MKTRDPSRSRIIDLGGFFPSTQYSTQFFKEVKMNFPGLGFFKELTQKLDKVLLKTDIVFDKLKLIYERLTYVDHTVSKIYPIVSEMQDDAVPRNAFEYVQEINRKLDRALNILNANSVMNSGITEPEPSPAPATKPSDTHTVVTFDLHNETIEVLNKIAQACGRNINELAKLEMSKLAAKTRNRARDGLKVVEIPLSAEQAEALKNLEEFYEVGPRELLLMCVREGIAGLTQDIKDQDNVEKL